jgi:hypothetical protein
MALTGLFGLYKKQNLPCKSIGMAFQVQWELCFIEKEETKHIPTTNDAA